MNAVCQTRQVWHVAELHVLTWWSTLLLHAFCVSTGEPLECEYEHTKASEIEASLVQEVEALVDRYRSYEQYVGLDMGQFGALDTDFECE